MMLSRLHVLPVLLASVLLPHVAPAQPAVQAPPGAQAPDTMAARLLACASCHGAQGQGLPSAYYPRLSGKPAGYLFNQLEAFRDGRRRYAPMNTLLAFMPDAYLHAIADHFAAQGSALPTRAVSVASDDVLARGRALVMHGDAARGIPACAGCHGATFTGMEPAIPGLLGLQPGYISAQLGAWRYGTRTAHAPDCMQIVAASLSEDDVTAVAAWLPTLSAPADPSPSPRATAAMPLACGSEPG